MYPVPSARPSRMPCPHCLRLSSSTRRGRSAASTAAAIRNRTARKSIGDASRVTSLTTTNVLPQTAVTATSAISARRLGLPLRIVEGAAASGHSAVSVLIGRTVPSFYRQSSELPPNRIPVLWARYFLVTELCCGDEPSRLAPSASVEPFRRFGYVRADRRGSKSFFLKGKSILDQG